jgi:delta(3,5)-delta(2,4)-dienoyl-CoA isomerase
MAAIYGKFVRKVRPLILFMFQCPQPVIAAIHSACVGAGIDVASACDIRFCSSDAFFSIKEVDVGLAADVGTLQRMPKAVGNDSLFRELAYTGRRFDAQEAKKLGFIR